MEPFRVDDWSGGITDHYLNGPLNRSRRLDNLEISRNKKLNERYGSVIEDETNYRIPAGVQRIGKIFVAEGQLFKQSARNLYYIAGGTYHTLVGPSPGNPALGAGTTANRVAATVWSKHTILTCDALSSPRVVFQDGSSTWQCLTLGLPDLASTPTGALTAGAATLSYAYAFCFVYTYMRGTVTETWRGPTTLLSVAGGSKAAIAGGSPCSIAGLPVLANGSTENYDLAGISKEIYRTTNGGTELRLVGSVANAVTTYSDVTTDAALTGIRLYTTGGVYDNDPPPLAKYCENVGGVVWFGNLQEGTELRPARLRQCLVDQPYSSPSDLTVDLDSDCTGLSSVDTYLLAFERSRLWRIEGAVDSLGAGVVRKRVVSKTVGTLSHESIVKSKKGCYFVAEDGFYFTDAFDTVKLSEHLDDSFRTLVQSATQQNRICGVEDPVTKRVYWSLMADTISADCDVLYVLDPYFGLTAESCFTTWSGGEGSTNFYATSMCFVAGDLCRADNRGHVFRHGTLYLTDPVVSVSAPASSWLTQTVRYDYVSCAWAFGDEVRKKYGPVIDFVAKNETNLSLQIYSINNDSGVSVPLKEFRFRSNIVWGDADVIWGDPSVIWNYQGTIIGQRHFPAGSIRFMYKQVRMTNSLTVIARSDDDGLATMDPSGPTALLLDATKAWPDDAVGYTLYTAADGYGEGFPVAASSATTLTVTDADSVFPTGDYAWLLRGYRKLERLKLESYTIGWMPHGESTPGFQKGDEGTNA